MGELPLTRVLGVVLAAGAGTRMGGPKAVLEVDGSRLLDSACAALAAGGCDAVAAVVPVGVIAPPGVETVENPAAVSGMRSSLQCALIAARGFDAVAVTLVDTPGVGADAVRGTVARWRGEPGTVVVARYNGERGHPIVMDVARWVAAVALAAPDEGARRYLAAHPGDVLEVAVEGDPADLDTPADLARWTSS